MEVKDKDLKKLLRKYKEICLLGKILSLVNWDLNVNMPSKASLSKAQQISYLNSLLIDKWQDFEFKKLLLRVKEKDEKLNEIEKSILRNLEKDAKYYHRVPKKLIIEKAKTTTVSFVFWNKAKVNNDFSLFSPYLKKIVEIEKEIAHHLFYKDNPYDALLDLYEPDLTSKKVKKIFLKLKPELLKIIGRLKKSPLYFGSEKLLEEKKKYPLESQKRLSFFVLNKMGFSFQRGRVDESPHPFTTSFSFFDVRITNRYKEDDFRESLMAAMHEGGHALYDQGISKDYENTPLGEGASLGIHESQSRFWENQIGRSFSFLKFLTPIFHAFYPYQLSRTTPEEFFLIFNLVRSGAIRIESDEVTYNLHILLRFEIEDDLINGKIKVEDLPEIWRENMRKYLGVSPKTDSEGVLQDVHWSYGSFGYFPTYTLGNLYAAQISERIEKELNIWDLVEKGELRPIRLWLKENIHRYGRLYLPEDLIKRITGKPLNVNSFVRYLKKKYFKIYKV